jgi:formate hydrogenlyase transcriptional activator
MENSAAQLVDNIPSLVWTVNAEGAIDFVNERLGEYTGLSLNQIQSMRWTDSNLIHPEDKPQFDEFWNAIVRSGEAGEFEARLKRHDGEYRWFLFRVVPRRDGSGKIFQWFGINFEIEERKWAEALLAGEKKLLEMIARDSSLADILDELCLLVERTASGSLCSILVVEPTSNKTHLAAPSLPPSFRHAIESMPLSEFSGPCGTAIVKKEQVIASDFASDTRWDSYRFRTIAMEHDLRSTWSTPIFSADQTVVGSFAIYSREPRTPTSRQQRIIAQITHLASITIDRIRTKLALKQSEERKEREFRDIVEAIPQLIGVSAADGSFLYANQLLLDYTGMTLQEFKASGFRDWMLHPEDKKKNREEREKGFARGLPFEVEARIRRNDGQYRWFLVQYKPMRDEAGNVLRWYGTGTDIDDRRKAQERVEKENIVLRKEIDKTSMFGEIVGTSAGIREVLSSVSRVAPTDSTVLITGETGTGKELIARAIHKLSPRAERAFITVDCAAIPQSLIASELFGHEKGAFTGALQRRAGHFELAEGGTIFLDEIGELPMETQIALLRVLQEREFRRVGGTQSIRTDVRVVAATNRNLQTSIESGTFRTDLFYRINVFPIEVPPLRERKEDIPLLVKYFIDRYAAKLGKKIRTIDKKSMTPLQSYSWPGNIRELQNVIERSMIICDGDAFAVDERWISSEPVATKINHRNFPKQVIDQQKEMIEAALNETKGRVSGSKGAAAKLGIPTSTLESKIRSLKIDKHRFKSNQ